MGSSFFVREGSPMVHSDDYTYLNVFYSVFDDAQVIRVSEAHRE